MLVRYKISNLSLFEGFVFGADCILEYWPEIKTTGILLKKCEDCYYVIDANSEIVDDTAFFTESEMQYLVEC